MYKTVLCVLMLVLPLACSPLKSRAPPIFSLGSERKGLIGSGLARGPDPDRLTFNIFGLGLGKNNNTELNMNGPFSKHVIEYLLILQLLHIVHFGTNFVGFGSGIFNICINIFELGPTGL